MSSPGQLSSDEGEQDADMVGAAGEQAGFGVEGDGLQPPHVHYIGLSATPSELALRMFGVGAAGSAIAQQAPCLAWTGSGPA